MACAGNFVSYARRQAKALIESRLAAYTAISGGIASFVRLRAPHPQREAMAEPGKVVRLKSPAAVETTAAASGFVVSARMNDQSAKIEKLRDANKALKAWVAKLEAILICTECGHLRSEHGHDEGDPCYGGRTPDMDPKEGEYCMCHGFAPEIAADA